MLPPFSIMPKQVLDYDPLTRTTTYHEFDADENKTIITEVQDIQPFLELAKEARKNEDYSAQGIKNEMWHYGKIPNSIIAKMLAEDGVDVYNKAQSKEVIRLINTKYPECKMTRKNHC